MDAPANPATSRTDLDVRDQWVVCRRVEVHVLIVQGDAFNRSSIATVVVAPLTSNLRWADAPGNVLLKARSTGLPCDSVANVSQIVALDRTALTDQIGRISPTKLDLVLRGIGVVLGR